MKLGASKGKADVNFFLENSLPHRICRFQSVRDLLLLYGYNIDYASLLLLGTPMSAACFELEYKGLKFPVICPGFFAGELAVLDALNIKYKTVTEEKNGAMLKAYLDAGTPVLCYYSADNLNDTRKNNSIGPMSSCVIIELNRSTNEFITNLSSVHFSKNQPCEKLLGAMQANLMPVSPEMRYVCIQKIDTIHLDDLLNQSIIESIKRCSKNQTVDSISRAIDGIQYFRGGKACKIMQDFFNLIGQNAFELSPREIIRFYAIYLRIAARFWCFEFDQANDGFDRKAYIKAVQQKHSANKTVLEWAAYFSPHAGVWDDIFALLCKDGMPNRASFSDTIAHAKKLSELFGMAKAFDDQMFLALSKLTF